MRRLVDSGYCTGICASVECLKCEHEDLYGLYRNTINELFTDVDSFLVTSGTGFLLSQLLGTQVRCLCHTSHQMMEVLCVGS